MMKDDEIKFWKEQERKAICLANSIRFYDDPFFQTRDTYCPIDAFNSSFWLEHKGTTYNRSKPNFPYELGYSKLTSIMNWIINDYNRSGEKRDLLLLLQHSVDKQVDQDIFFGNPCQLHLINLTETLDFQPLFKDRISPSREWPWKGKEEVYVHNHGFDDRGAITIIPQRGELIWNSYAFCRILKILQIEREEKQAKAANGKVEHVQA